jgi:hypothetical protein
MNLTPAQKAIATRKRNTEFRKRKEAEKKEIIAKVKGGLLSVLDSEEASPEEKLEASKLLMELM